MRPVRRIVLVAALLGVAGGALASPQELSDVARAPRPKGGEFFGLYLMNKKVGYVFTDLTLDGPKKERVKTRSEFVFKANVGQKLSERQLKDERLYESKPGGRLLSFRIEQKGDGGDQTLEATSTGTGLRVVVKRPGQPNQVLNLPPSREKVEDADQARVAVLRNKEVEGFITDAQDLGHYKVSTTVGGEETRLVSGVKVNLRKAVTLSEKEKVPIAAFITDFGEVVELNFGQTMRAVAEPESVAKRLDQVEVFGLTRVVLPKLAPEKARSIPGAWTLVVTGLPEKFHQNTFRQKFKKLSGDQVEVTLMGVPPKGTAVTRPVADPTGGQYLKSSIVVESTHPDIQAMAKKILGGEKDALSSLKRITTWVAMSLKKDYGASADRASDVLRQLKGDCTEHSLLTVALLRAAGIPAKRVDGLVYMVNEDKVPALYWHEWVEAFVGEWTQVDPTFNQPVADATHFAVGEEGNAEITPLIGQLKVLEVK
jgi:hypothetical protein